MYLLFVHFRVGKNISTKMPRKKNSYSYGTSWTDKYILKRLDVTNEYKYNEGKNKYQYIINLSKAS